MLNTNAFACSFEAKRVIIRQGHTADNFYFILSGTGKYNCVVLHGCVGCTQYMKRSGKR